MRRVFGSKALQRIGLGVAFIVVAAVSCITGVGMGVESTVTERLTPVVVEVPVEKIVTVEVEKIVTVEVDRVATGTAIPTIRPDALPVEIVQGSKVYRIERGNGPLWRVPYQFTLQNNTNQQKTVRSIRVQFVDAEGFVIEMDLPSRVTLPPFGRHTVSELGLLAPSGAQRVADFRVDWI